MAAKSEPKQPFSVKDLNLSLDKAKARDHLLAKLKGETWTCEVQILNPGENGATASVALGHPDFREHIFLYAPALLKGVERGQCISGSVVIGNNKRGRYRFELRDPKLCTKESDAQQQRQTPDVQVQPGSQRGVQSTQTNSALEGGLKKHVMSICAPYCVSEQKKAWAWMKQNRGAGKEKSDKTESQAEVQRCYGILKELVSHGQKQQVHPVVPLSVAERKADIERLSKRIEQLSKKLQVQSITELYALFREREQLQWDESRLNSWKDEVAQTVAGETFVGKIEMCGAGYGLIRSPFFREQLFLPHENVMQGVLKAKAKVSFEVRISWNTKNDSFKFEPIRVVSQASRQDIQGVTASLKHWISHSKKLTAAGKPVLIVPEGARHSKELNRQQIQEQCPSGYRIFRIDELDANEVPTIYRNLVHHCFVARPEIGDAKLQQKRLKHAFARHLFPRIVTEEKNAWTVVMDETGSCMDHVNPEALPSVMMAVLIPPGSSPPPCPIGYHSIESGAAGSWKLREEFLKDPNIYCISWTYRSGQPYAHKDYGPALHLQMWRHALVFCLENIALENSSQTDAKKVPVHVYVENIMELNPGSKALDAFTVDLADQLQKRTGWKNLDISPPRIVGKDEHPYMGYVDCLGHIFRMDRSRMTEDVYRQASAILERKKTLTLPYDAEALQNLANIIRQSGNAPFQALTSPANSRETSIRPYSKTIRNMGRFLFAELSPMEIERICATVQDNLSKTPKLYYANDLLSASIDAAAFSRLHIELQTTASLNRLASANFKGNTREAEKYLIKIQELMPEVNRQDLYYRFLAQLIDYYQNCLDFESALKMGFEDQDRAKKDSRTMESAAHVLGANFLTLALSGKTTEAQGEWEMIYELQRSLEDRLRYFTYQLHAFIDLQEWERSWSVIATIKKDYAPLQELCLDNYYLLAAVLKLEAHKTGLTHDEKKYLMNIKTPHSHPGQLIAFWRFQVQKQAGERPAIDTVKQRIESCNANRCNALRLIHACLQRQLTADGDCEESDIQVENVASLLEQSPEIKRVLEQTESRKGARYSCLQPLCFNFW